MLLRVPRAKFFFEWGTVTKPGLSCSWIAAFAGMSGLRAETFKATMPITREIEHRAIAWIRFASEKAHFAAGYVHP
jgi:hypothetical protein